MLHNIIQTYFHVVAAWLRNFNIMKRSHHSNFLVWPGGSIGSQGLRGALEDGYSITIFEADGKQVVQRFPMGEVNDDGTLKKVWIHLTLHAANTVDKLPR